MRRYLGFDLGALRCGYALVSSDPWKLHASGIAGIEKGEDEKYQDYKSRLVAHWVDLAPKMLDELRPTHVSMEILPAVGSGNFVAATQSELGKAVATVIHVVALQRHLPVSLVAASSAKKAVVGRAGSKAKPVTKVVMRNAIFEVFPELSGRKWLDDLQADEVDAISVALCSAGFSKSKWREQ